MLNDTVPTFWFNRPRPLSPSTRPSRRNQPAKAPDGQNTAQLATEVAEADRTGAQASSRDAVADDAERFLHQAKGLGSQPLGSSRWLQRAGLNIREASDAQHFEAIALAYATYI